jgi:23S rRNA pseudouridine1911/1915/1917 synthase
MATEELVGEPGRLDAVVARLTGASRADVQRALERGLVLVDGRTRAKSFLLAGGERLVVDLGAELPVPPEPGGVDVRYRDDHLLVVSKPAGLVTHPTASRRTGTLVNRLLSLGVPLSRVNGPLRPGIVHRLDAGTSGLMLVALTDDAHAGLADMLRRHEIERRYVCLVRGAAAHDSFTVDAPLGRRGAKVALQAVTGKEARTSFDVLERFAHATLLEARPMTGRTHQIRVHLASVGHPILGDRRYGGAGEEARAIGLARPFLHSRSVSFTHPITGERIEIEDDGLPQDLTSALTRLRRGSR